MKPRVWPVVAAAFVVMFVSFGTIYSFGVFVLPYEKALGLSRAAVAGIGGLTTGTFLFSGAFTGPLADRFGTRRMIVVGSLLMLGGLVAASRVGSTWQLYLTHGFVVGLGVASNYVAAFAAVARTVPQERRAFLIGVVAAGSGVGTLVYAPVVRRLIDVVGYQGALVTMGLAGTVLLVAASTQLQGKGTPDADGPRPLDAIRSRVFKLIWVGGLFASIAFFVPIVHLVPYAESRGFSELFGAILVGAIGGASTVGRFALGGVATRFGHSRALAAMPLGMAVSFAIWLVAGSSGALLVVFAILYGAFQGGFVALMPTVVADHFGTANLAAIIGLVNTSAALGTLAGPAAAGAFYDAFGSYTVPIAASLAVTLVGFAMLVRLPAPASEGETVTVPG